jgi:hypothetical protein
LGAEPPLPRTPVALVQQNNTFPTLQQKKQQLFLLAGLA